MRASLLLGVAVVSCVALASPRDARACGGCFHEEQPPQQQQKITVVTDHRMIFSVSKTQTTLYDQIKYMGDPSSFAWVLPIRDTVTVGLSADAMFASLDTITQSTLVAPPLPPCPPPPVCYGEYYGGSSGCSCGSASADSFNGASPGADQADAAQRSEDASTVVITKQEVVGPYETVQLKAADPMSITDWLTANKYAIPDDVKPIIAAYQQEGFGFLALKLKPGANVAAMRPVRVSTAGAGLGLPLRMVAAGTGATVGVTLWIVGEGRYEPQNFPTFRIATDDLVWDWSTQSSNYSLLRSSMSKATSGHGWEIESSINVQASTLINLLLQTPASVDYLPVMDPKNPKNAEEVRVDDFAAVFSGLSIARVTRVRADLAHEALASDLYLKASDDQGVLSNVRALTKDTNRPACPTYPPCPPQAAKPGEGARGGAACAASSSPSDFGVGVFASALLLGVLRRRRR